MTPEKFIKQLKTTPVMVDINNIVRAELSNTLGELTCSQQQQWHDSIWPHLSESLPDGRLSINRALLRRGGGEGGSGKERSSAEYLRQ